MAEPDLHAPSPGQTQNLCEFYSTFQRGVIEMQARLICDLQRRLDGKPITQEHINRLAGEPGG